MTSNIDFVKDYLERAWKDVPTSLLEVVQETFADDFQAVDVNGSVTMDKEAYIGGGQMMAAALDGFRWELTDLQEDGDGVIVTGHFEGIHTRDLDLSALGAGTIPASGKKVVFPEAKIRWVIEGNKIARQEDLNENASFEAFIGALTG